LTVSFKHNKNHPHTDARFQQPKCNKFNFNWKSAPDPIWEAYMPIAKSVLVSLPEGKESGEEGERVTV